MTKQLRYQNLTARELGMSREELERAVENEKIHGLFTSYQIRRIPYVPSAVRNLPFTIHQGSK